MIKMRGEVEEDCTFFGMRRDEIAVVIQILQISITVE